MTQGKASASIDTRVAGAFPANLPPWFAERAAVLKPICIAIEQRQKAGISVNKSCGLYARRNGRAYHSAPQRLRRLRPKTIRRIFYTWKVEGDACLVPGYRTAEPPRRGLLAEF